MSNCSQTPNFKTYICFHFQKWDLAFTHNIYQKCSFKIFPNMAGCDSTKLDKYGFWYANQMVFFSESGCVHHGSIHLRLVFGVSINTQIYDEMIANVQVHHR